MKRILTTFILLLIIGTLCFFYKDIVSFIMYNTVYKDDFKVQETNEYYKKDNWLYVEETDTSYPSNKQDIINIFYTALNKGYEDITFFCTDGYKDCTNDVEEIARDSSILSNINNFVSPYNSYKKIIVNLNNFGRVNIKIEKLYTNEQINILNRKIDEIYNKIINDNMSNYDKIKAIHDYIINNTIYDKERSKEINNGGANNNSTSSIAYGPLIEGKAICGGYTDAMALFLDKMGITNYKVASEKHIWNVLYIDNEWKHLDLTWDDPVVNTGENMLTYAFFLLSTDELKEKNTGQHDYDSNIFVEVK